MSWILLKTNWVQSFQNFLKIKIVSEETSSNLGKMAIT